MSSFQPWQSDEHERAKRDAQRAIERALDLIDHHNPSPESVERFVRQVELDLGIEISRRVLPAPTKRPQPLTPTNRLLLEDARKGLHTLAGLVLLAFFGGLASGQLIGIVAVCLVLIASLSILGGLVIRHISPMDDK